MLRIIIAVSALIVPTAAFAADAPTLQLLERDGTKYEYTTTPSPLGGLTIKGRELPSAANASGNSFTLFVSPKGQVSGDYAGSPVDFRSATYRPVAAGAASMTQIAAK